MGGGSRKGLATAAAIAAVLAVLDLGFLHLLQPRENQLLDFFVRSHAATLKPDPDIVIVDVDEKSLNEMGERWPWPRLIHGELVRGLVKQKPKAIVFDITFSERDQFRKESDAEFNDALKGLDNVYFPLVRQDVAADKEGAPIAWVAEILRLRKTPQADEKATVALIPPEAIDEVHWGQTGAINFLKDQDGVGRRYYIWLDASGWKIPSLPARVATALGYPVPDVESIVLAWRGQAGTGDPARKPSPGDKGCPPTRAGPANGFKHFSYIDLYRDFGLKTPKCFADAFRDKIVVVGSAANSLFDLRVTPISNQYPGVEMLATAIDNLKNDRRMHQVPAVVPVAITLALIALLYLAFLRHWHMLRLGVTLAVASVVFLWASYQAAGALWLLPALVPLLFVWAFYFTGALIEYRREKRSREQAVRMFSRFLNPRVVRDLVEQGQTVESLSGKLRDVSVLFSDIRGFTTLSETHPPEEIVALLNRYFSRQVDVVFRHGGTLDKFIGDAIMAFWGAPVENPNHARDAVAAALEMIRVLEEFKRELANQGSDMADAFDVGIGIHSGHAVVGFIGAEQKLDYTAIGDTVNLASRIEGTTKGVARVLVSGDTAQACGDAFDFAPRGSYKVKGRTQEVELFEPMARAS